VSAESSIFIVLLVAGVCQTVAAFYFMFESRYWRRTAGVWKDQAETWRHMASSRSEP
jgi:hypothetical protein